MKEFSAFYVDLWIEIWNHLRYFFEVVLWNNTIKRFFENIADYWDLLMFYSEDPDFNTLSWIMVVVAGLLNISLIIFLVLRIYIWIKRYFSFRKIEIEKNELIEEIAELNERVIDLVDEKNQILAMKVSQLGINARTGDTGDVFYPKQGGLQPAFSGASQGYTGGAQGMSMVSPSVGSPETLNQSQPVGPSRFVKLIQVDKEYAGRDTHIYMEDSDNVSLPELVTRFVNFAASKLKLYYTPRMVSYFFAGMAASKIIILEGISGTGKTSLPYAMGKFFDNPSEMISVQPAWRDRAEILGYLNEFTKRFNETDFLKALYEAIYRKDVNFIVLDELNLARIEYYFAEFLSIMEMPDPNEWKIDLVPDSKPSDPLKVINGKITVPLNLWFVGTANKDDSTFTITDKVYDRAISLEFDTKGEPFQAPETESIHMSSAYLQELFDEAFYKFPVSEETLSNFKILDKYIQAHFRISFGNRILAQVYKFVPVYVACGGTEIDALDYIFAYKILRKFESLNLAFLQNELTELINQIKKIFGKNAFEESVNFIKNLQKLS
ncbi:MAG: hypothetical protein RBR50_08310 [Candidatus Izemoplasmatales bacterium]|nr:hypothetical protein [Candidatus Izemoplasmatales bacterium]